MWRDFEVFARSERLFQRKHVKYNDFKIVIVEKSKEKMFHDFKT